MGLPKIEVLSDDSRSDEVLFVVGAKIPDTLAAVLSLGVSPFPFILFCGLSDLNLGRLPSSSEEPSTKRDSLLAKELSSTSVTSSKRPCAWAWLALRPLITAGNVRPSRLFSTKYLEKVGFRGGF